MKLYAPLYYKRFKCIADKCQNSCCINWEIDIDDATYEKYMAKDLSFADNMTESDGVRCFRLSDDGRCPYLNERGLCDIIIKYGDDHLTDICREHPRFYHEIGDRREVGIGLVCEEAARLIVTDTEPFLLEWISESDEPSEQTTKLSIAERDEIIKTVLSSDGDTDSRIKALEEKYSVGIGERTLPEWLKLLSELEILDDEWPHLIASAVSASKTADISGFDAAFTALLVYFLFRHASTAESEIDLRARIAFSVLSVRIIAYLFERAETVELETLIRYAGLYSSEIEYSEDNTAELIFELVSAIT